MKIPCRAFSDYLFFSSTSLDMIGSEIGVVGVSDPSGLSALECFYMKDTHGKSLPCRELDVLQKVFRAKASWNLQIKMWAESMAEGTLSRDELFQYCKFLPPWIRDATLRQANKIFLKANGWEPKFLEEIY